MLLEYSHGDIERKFRESAVKAKVIVAPGVSVPGFYFIHGTAMDDDEVVKVNASKYPITSDQASWFFVSTLQRPTTRLPRMEFQYWNPDTGIYRGNMEGHLYLVQRRIRRAFCVGLNHHSYLIHRYANGKLWDTVGAIHVDPTKPRLFHPDPDVLTEKLYRIGSSLMFNGQRIGLIQNQKIVLSDPDYLTFIPEEFKGSCTVNL